MKPTHPISVHRMLRIVDLLRKKDLNQQEVAAALFITRPAGVKAYLDHLRQVEHAIHIVRWTPRGINGHTWPVFRFGAGADAEPPPIKPKAEVHRAWRVRSGYKRKSPPVKVDKAAVFAPLLAGVES